jgi:two-component system, NarL family, sensor kinase
LQWYADGFAERSAIKVDLQIDSDFGRLPPAMEIAVFRVIQECLTNIHRHSGSTGASIRVNRTTERIDIEISDSGKGISPDHLRDGKVISGVGMMGMHERMRQFGGSLEVTSSNDGTAVVASIPLKE